jgi:hypothetical protein
MLPADECIVTTFARSPRRLVFSVALAATLCLALLGAGSASAFVSGNFGLQLREGVNAKAMVSAGPLQYHSGPILHSSDVYVVYWDPNHEYRGDWERLIDRFFSDTAAESGKLGDVFALDGQYTGGGGRAANQMTFRGSYKDEDAYPASENCTEPGSVCLTDSQIETELKHVIASSDPPLPGATGTPVYYMLTPPGVTVCTGTGSPGTCSNSTALEEEVKKDETPVKSGICGYHSALEIGGPSPVPYVVQPWVAGDAGLFIESYSPLKTSSATSDVLACQDNSLLEEPNQLAGLNPFGTYAEGLPDVLINDISIEQRDVVADPFLNGWYQTSTHAEQGDACQFNFGPPPKSPPSANEETNAAAETNEAINGHPYYLSWAYNSTEAALNGSFACWSGAGLEPFFTAPSPVAVGDVVGFNGTESDITLLPPASGLPSDEPFTAVTYSWNFGDGSTLAGTTDASVFHTYAQGGDYVVKLTVTDGGGNSDTAERVVAVVGSAGGASSSSGSTTSATTGTGSTAGGAGAGAPGSPGSTAVPPPVATATILSRALEPALHSGLAVRYSVNEQVAGRFEVLLSNTMARRLKVQGTPAVGLPAGSSSQLVIAKAVLVTTKGGRSTIRIQFSKKTAARLAHTHKLGLMLRLIVRNAASASPLSTTVLSTATLTG